MEKIQRTIRLSEQDLQAIAHIRDEYGLTSDSEAIRFALQLVSKGTYRPGAPAPKKERRSHPVP